MKSIQKILVLVLMALVVFQLPAQNRRGKSATISGTVVDKKTNKPVEAAVIVLSHMQEEESEAEKSAT